MRHSGQKPKKKWNSVDSIHLNGRQSAVVIQLSLELVEAAKSHLAQLEEEFRHRPCYQRENVRI